MLIWGGLILDRFGIRFTGKLAAILMVVGTGLEYYAITVYRTRPILYEAVRRSTLHSQTHYL